MAASSRDFLGASKLLCGTVLLGKWRIVRPLAKGGMSTVYEGVHRNGRRVAVKVLHSNLAADSEGRKRFLRESHLANRVQHPGVVAILDDDATPDGTLFLVMELLEGETLHQRWERHGRILPVPEVLAIVVEILGALAAVHAVGIVHRDLKPSNVFLTSAGVKLLDFGVAHLREKSEEETAITRSGSMLGTPAFMAPEQARGHWLQVDATTDLWAVGAIMFTLLAGRFVHDGSSAQELLISAATQAPLSLRGFGPDVPEAVVALVDKALNLEKSNRWPDAVAMLAEVRALVQANGGPRVSGEFFAAPLPVTEPAPETAASSTFPARKRGRRPVLLWSVLGAAIAAGAAVVEYATRGPLNEKPPLPSTQPLLALEAPAAGTPHALQSAAITEVNPRTVMESGPTGSDNKSSTVSSASVANTSGPAHTGRPRRAKESQSAPLEPVRQTEDVPQRTPSETFSGIAVDSETLNQRK